jgi:hypothetical protein
VKPVDLEQLSAIVENAIESGRLSRVPPSMAPTAIMSTPIELSDSRRPCKTSLRQLAALRHHPELYDFSIERDLAIEPGEVKDLGALRFGKNGKPIKR